MSFFSLNEQNIGQIEKYTRKMRHIFPHIEDASDDEIEDDIYGLALTQCLTNIYEAASKVSIEELEDRLLPVIRRSRVIRHIASHQYDAINWGIVKSNTRIILKLATPDFFEDCMRICAREKNKVVDYTLEGDFDGSN